MVPWLWTEDARYARLIKNRRLRLTPLVAAANVASITLDPRSFYEPDLPGRLLAQDTTWNIKRVKADSVWPTTTGAGVKLLVIDNGADSTHPDINYAYVSGGCTTTDGINSNNHGLKVAGVAAAASNSIGPIGVAHGVALYSIDASDDGKPWIVPAYALCAVEEGILNGVHVMNLSFGFAAHTGLTDALNNAYYQHDIVLIGATGDEGITEPVMYPASLPAVIAVGGTTANNFLWSGSHTGPEVELVAPAAGVPLLCTDQPYTHCADWVGTSFAAPHVAAGAALLRSYDSTWTASEIRRRLAVGAYDLSPTGRDYSFGYGLLDIKAALNAAPPDTASVTIDGPTLVKPSAACTWTANVSGGVSPFKYVWSPAGSSTDLLEYTNTFNHGNWFTIYVSVVGADLAPGAASLVVHVSSSAPECPS